MRWSKLLSLLLLIASAYALQPRGADAQNLAQIYEVSPTAGADLAAAIGEHADWREQNGDPWTWLVYEVVQGDNLGNFIIRSPDHTWADFDAYEEFEQRALENYATTMGPAVGSIRGWISMPDTAHQRLPASMEGIQLYQVISWAVKPDRIQDFQEAIDKFHQAIVQTDWPARYSFVNPVVGTAGPSTTLVIFHEDWASFEPPETSMDQMMAQVYGEETGAIFQQFGGAFTAERSFVLRLRPDLSVNAGM